MNQNRNQTESSIGCPQPAVLKHLLQGLLEPPELEHCESHVADCQQCHETLRGLNVNDTLSEYVSGAIQAKRELSELEKNEASKNKSSDSQFVENIVQKMLHPSRRANFDRSGADPEMLADRAAEVLRYLEPVASNSETDDPACLGVLGNYSLIRLIGAGSTGVVFHAIDQSLDRSVALKVLRPSLGTVARDRFLAEAKVAASIEHTNVVTIYQVGSQDRLAFIAMQWSPGQTLEQRLQESELDEFEIRQILTQISAGLSAAHEKQLVHRDIKPANIWICDENNEVKILDFGLARIADDDPGLTATGMLAGTPNFMSPEQTRGLELDGRSDLFSLGCVMYRLLTGRLPFGAPTVLATLQSIQNEQPVAPQSIAPDISAELSDLTMCLLEKKPNNRLQSASQLKQMVQTPRGQWPQAVLNYSRTAETSVSHTKSLTTDSTSASNSFSGRGWIALVGLALLGFCGYWFAPQIVRIVTDQGEIVVDANDENVSIKITRDGEEVTVLDTTTQNSFNIRSGEYEIEAVGKNSSGNSDGNSFEVTPNSFKMLRGQQAIVTVRKKPLSGSNPANSSSNANATAIENADSNSIDDRPSVYSGRTFAQWHDIANRDLDPKTAGEALVACSRLADSNSKKETLFQLLKKLTRIYGSHIDRGAEHPFPSSFHKAFSVFQPKDLMRFATEELESGNDKSRGACVWLVIVGTVYENNTLMHAKHSEAISESAWPLLDATLNVKDMDAQVKSLLVGSLVNTLCDASTEVKTSDAIRASAMRHYRACVDGSRLKRQIGRLAVAYHAKDKEFFAEYVTQLFNPETKPADRELALERICGFEFGAETEATIWLLLLENQFPHPDDKERHKWLESVFVNLPQGYTATDFSIAEPAKFVIIDGLSYDRNGIVGANIYGKNFRGYFDGGMGGVFRQAVPSITGKPAVVRFLLSKLWHLAPEFSQEFQVNVVSKFLDNWMSENDIDAKFGEGKNKGLEIGRDVTELMNLTGRKDELEEMFKKKHLSPFAKQAVQIKNAYGSGGYGIQNGFGGPGGGGIF